jgi:DNA-binding MarR family transcriptional regulator
MAVMLTIYLSPDPKSVGDLAADLGVAKPVISRALDTLAGLGLLGRRRDVDDRRKVFVERTREGQAFVDAHARLMAPATARQSTLGA